MAADLRAAFDRVLQGSGFILGEEVEGFEAEFAAYCGVAHCVGVASGTAALTLALRAAGIGPGDEVVVPAHTYIASALGVLHAGAAPVFCDVEDDTGLIDADAALAAMGPRTAAVLGVHLYGQACDVEALREVARRHGALLMEDAAQAHGARHGDSRTGSLGAAGCFSFYPSKNLGALGDGGAICTDDEGLAQRARELRNIGQRAKGQHVVAGYNERLDGVQAALLRVKLAHLDGWNDARRAIAATYRERLPDTVRCLAERPASPCTYHLFPIRVGDRDGLSDRLASRGVQTGVHYAPVVADQPPFRDATSSDGLVAARAWAAEELSLPMFAELRPDEVEFVVSALRAEEAAAPELERP